MNYYDLLGVTPSATTDEIRHAYLLKAQLLHPDRHNGAPDGVVAKAQKAMAQLNHAWQVLQDPAARRSYDEGVGLLSRSDASTAPDSPPVEPHPPVHAEPLCQHCAGAPAIRVKFAAQKGRIIFRVMERVEGTFCRSCGQALGRHMTDTTLKQGWWGYISFFWNFVVIARNLFRLQRVRRLAPPSWPNGAGAFPPLHPGRPLYRRVGMVMALVGLLVGGGVIAAAATNSGSGSSSSGSSSSYGGPSFIDTLNNSAVDQYNAAYKTYTKCLDASNGDTGSLNSCNVVFADSLRGISIVEIQAEKDRDRLVSILLNMSSFSSADDFFNAYDQALRALAADLHTSVGP